MKKINKIRNEKEKKHCPEILKINEKYKKQNLETNQIPIRKISRKSKINSKVKEFNNFLTKASARKSLSSELKFHSVILLLSIIILSILTLTTTNQSKNQPNNPQEELNSKFSSINLANSASFISRSIQITGSINATSLYSSDIQISNSTQISNYSLTNSIIANEIITEEVEVDNIRSLEGELLVQGNIVLINEIEAESLNLEVEKSFSVKGVRQWILNNHDDFENKESLEGWSDIRVSFCSGGAKHSSTNIVMTEGTELNVIKEKNKIDNDDSQKDLKTEEISNLKNHFLGGHCNFSHNEVVKTFKNLPNHSKVKIGLKYHFIDAWEVEVGYVKFNNKVAWSQASTHFSDANYDSNDKNINSVFSLCGDPGFPDAIGEHVEFTVNNSDPEFSLAIGSTIKNDPCKQSFGIDDVSIYVK